MNFSRFAVVGFALLVAAPLSAQVTAYSTRAALNSAAGPLTTETFDACGTSTQALSYGTTLSSSSLGPCASLQAGVTFGTASTTQLYIAAPGQSANLTTALGMNIPGGGDHRIGFAAGTRAFGVDLFQNFGGGSQSGSAAPFWAQVFGASGLLSSFDLVVDSGTGSFFGFTSTVDVTEVRIAQSNGFAVMDNVSFDGVSVPEPSSFALIIPGLGLLGVMARRRVRIG